MAELNEVQRTKLWKYIGVNAWETVERNHDQLGIQPFTCRSQQTPAQVRHT